MSLYPRVSCAALALLLGLANASAAQEAQVWFGSAPLSAPSATPAFTLNVVESPKRPAPTMPSVTVVETPLGPRMSNLALKLPPITIADTAVASQLGDQTLPRTFSSSPWAGSAVKRPMRGLSFSTAGTTPVSFHLGQLDASSRPPQSSNVPGVVALTMGVTSSKELSVTPRALVPVGSKTAQSNVGTAIRADVSQHVSLVSDVGAAGTTQHGWDPLAAAGVVGHWSGAEVETNLLRGTSPVSASNVATVGSLDREIVRGLVRSIPGMTISTQASWSRPASAPTSTDTTVRSIGVAYDRLPLGVLTATRQGEDSSRQQTATTSIAWRRKPVDGIVVRYTEREQTRDRLQPTVVSKQVELELPGWIERDFRNRLDVHAVLTDSPMLGTPTVSSKLSGRFDIIADVGVTGDTEIGISRSGPTLRELRVASKVSILERTAVQLVYTYQGRGPYALFENQSFEARLLRSAPLLSW